MGLFSKKKGGTFFGNALASIANKYSGGVLGAKRSAALMSGDLASINPLAAKIGKSFAGLPSTTSDNGVINISQSLPEVKVSPITRSSILPENVGIIDKLIGDKAAYFGARFSEKTSFGADDKTLWIIGGAIGILALAIYSKK